MRKELFLLILLLLGMIPLAQAQSCGDTLTADTTLTEALQCQGDGLVLAGEGMTLDCANNQLTGTADATGISVQADGITLLNCQIASFGLGVRIESVNGVTVRATTLEQNNIGIGVNDAEQVSLSEVSVSQSTIGIVLEDESLSAFTVLFTDNAQDLVNQTVESAPEPAVEPIEAPEPIAEPEPVPEPVEEPVPPPEPEPTPVSAREMSGEDLLEEILKLEFDIREIEEDVLRARIEKLEETLKHVDIKRSFRYLNGRTEVTIQIIPKKTLLRKAELEDFALYDKIPKCFASLAEDIILGGGTQPVVLEEDPLMVWHLQDSFSDDQEITYAADKRISETCKEAFLALGIAEKMDFTYRVWPILIIPVVVALFGFLHIFRRRYREQNL